MAARIEQNLNADISATRYSLGMWVALASIAMLFTSLSSAYVVRAASANDWFPLVMPRILILSTALIVVSSVTLEVGRRQLKRSLSGTYSIWLLITAVLGLAFLASQFIAWKQLARQGVYIASNPHSSFFYVLTAAHGVHIAGGLFALIILSVRSQLKRTSISARGRAAWDAISIYWHFMDALWIYLLVLLFLWR